MTRPSALAHAATRKRVAAVDPTQANAAAQLARRGAERKAGNVPTSLGVTPHGVRDPGTQPTETTAKRNGPCHGMRPAPQQSPPCMMWAL